MDTPLDELTEVLQAEVARFPRARLSVLKGPDKGAQVLLEGQTVVVGTDESCQLRLSDPSVSRRHLELSGGPGGYRLRDLRSTNGVHLEGLQVLEARLSQKLRFTIGRTELRFEPERHHEIAWPLSAHERFGEVLGKSVQMRRLFAILERAALTSSPVVLEGEPGSGREALARALHQRSERAEGPFVVVDLASSAELLMESDLFGYDATQNRPLSRPGALEEASGGVLYLDEVGELPLALQARVARALESAEVRRSSHAEPVKIDVRVVASSQRDLEAGVRGGRFREDLFFALAVLKVRVPPLRERSEDVALLARHFAASARGQAINEETLDMLCRHDWPGNVRELRNVLERLAAFPDPGAASIARALGKPASPEGEENGAARLRAEVSSALLALPYHQAKERVLESFEKTYLSEHLKSANGVVTRAALRSGLPRQSFHRMLRRLGLSSSED